MNTTSNLYKIAVVDTIIAEIQNTLKKNRCVLFLNYKKKMKKMFQNINSSLSRRFALNNIFDFENFDDNQLRKILEFKFKKQYLKTTKKIKNVVISMLVKIHYRFNFDNAKKIKNMINYTKILY